MLPWTQSELSATFPSTASFSAPLAVSILSTHPHHLDTLRHLSVDTACDPTILSVSADDEDIWTVPIMFV